MSEDSSSRSSSAWAPQPGTSKAARRLAHRGRASGGGLLIGRHLLAGRERDRLLPGRVSAGRGILGDQIGQGTVGRGAPLCLPLVLAAVTGARLQDGGAPLQRPAVGHPAGTEDRRAGGRSRGSSPGHASVAMPRLRDRPLRATPAARPALRIGTGRIPRRASGRQPGSMDQPVMPGPTSPPKRSPGIRAARARARARLGAVDAALVAPAHLGRQGVTPQQGIDGLGDVGVDGHAVAVLDLDDDVEGGRRLALQDATSGCPGGAPPRRPG